MYTAETSCMKGTSVHMKNVWIKQLCNRKIPDFAMALRARKVSGDFEKRVPGTWYCAKFRKFLERNGRPTPVLTQTNKLADTHSRRYFCLQAIMCQLKQGNMCYNQPNIIAHVTWPYNLSTIFARARLVYCLRTNIPAYFRAQWRLLFLYSQCAAKKIWTMINTMPLFGAKIWSYVCPWTLSALQSSVFLELRSLNTVRFSGQIS